MSKTPIDGLKLVIKVGIGHNTSLLALSPQQLLEAFDPSTFTNLYETDDRRKQQDVKYIIENLQECLNNLIDARKRLINLGLYELDVDYEEKGISSKQQVQVRTREEIPSILEEDEYSNSNPIQVPPDETMEI